MGSLQVIKKGFQTTIQDLGRFGFRKLGIPTSGAADSKSLMDANSIVGNPKTNPVLEHTFYGGIYRFNTSSIISITGAKCNPTINGRVVSQYVSIEVKIGDEVEINHPERGCRVYMAVQGVFDLPKVMESYSTYLPAKFGGYNGKVLEIGDTLEWKTQQSDVKSTEFPKENIPYFSSKIAITIENGPEYNKLDDQSVKRLFSGSFVVDSQSNRMGIRLTGEKLISPNFEMVSSPVIPGVIQLPPSGNPIILMNDGQTIGGYPRIGIVNEPELWRLGQVKTGDRIKLVSNHLL